MNTRCKFHYKSGLYFLSYPSNVNQETIFTDGFESMSTWDKTNNSFGHSLTALDTTKKKSGSYSGRIDDNYPANWEKYVYSDTWTPINNSQDTYYTVSGWIYVENIANNDAQIWLSTRKSGETRYPSGNYSSKTTQRGRWEYLSKTVLVPADVRELNIRIDNNKKGKVWFDDVKIVKGNASQTVIVEESNYYPFGLKHKGYNNVVSSNGNSVAQKFGYNGKELNQELGLEWHDFSARNYDASLGRWMNLDPLAEQMRRHSPYNYAFDNPIYFIDPDGMKPHGPGKPGEILKTTGGKVIVAVSVALDKTKKFFSSVGNFFKAKAGHGIWGNSKSGAGAPKGNGAKKNLGNIDVSDMPTMSKFKGNTLKIAPTVKNVVNAFKAGFKDAKTTTKLVKKGVEAVTKSEPDTTVTVNYPNGIKDFNPSIPGGMTLSDTKDSTVTLPKSKALNFIKTTKSLLNAQHKKAEQVDHKDIDKNTGGN